jgi:hypothetical protein
MKFPSIGKKHTCENCGDKFNTKPEVEDHKLKDHTSSMPEYKYAANYKHKPIIDWEDRDDDYIKNRLGPFILFLDNERVKTRDKESKLQYILLVAGVLIPIVNIGGAPVQISGILSSALGGIVVVCAGLLQFGMYHERWLSFKMITTKLSNEYYYWKNKVGDYAVGDLETNAKCPYSEARNLSLLVKRCENIILSEASDYARIFSPPNKPESEK